MLSIRRRKKKNTCERLRAILIDASFDETFQFLKKQKPNFQLNAGKKKEHGKNKIFMFVALGQNCKLMADLSKFQFYDRTPPYFETTIFQNISKIWIY